MEVFPLRPLRISAFSALMGLSRREPQRYAEAAEKTNQICHFLCKAAEIPRLQHFHEVGAGFHVHKCSLVSS